MTENAVAGYKTAITGNQTEGFVVTNSLEPLPPVPPKNPPLPKTGETLSYLAWGMGFLLLLASFGLIDRKKRG